MDESFSAPATVDVAVLARARATLGQHVMMRLEDDRIIALSAADRRMVARLLYEQGESRGLLAFRVVASHIHALLACDRAQAGQFARGTTTAARRLLGLGVGFARARIKPIADQHHLENTFWYVLRQEQRHGIDVDPLHDGSHLPELLGARVLFDRRRATAGVPCRLGPRTIDSVARLLPRVRQRALLGEVGGAAALESAHAALDHLAAAAAAAFGLADLHERAWETPLARRAAAHAARTLASPATLAEHLRISTRAVQRHQATPIDPAFVRAVDLQLRLRARPATTD